MKSSILLATVAVMATGCAVAPHQAIDPNVKAALRNQSVALTTRERTDFTTYTLAMANAAAAAAAATPVNTTGMNKKAAGFAIGFNSGLASSMARRAADRSTKPITDAVADPAQAIAARLVADLIQQEGVKPAASNVSVPKGSKAADIAAAARGNAAYVLDVETVTWGMAYQPANPMHYDFKMRANAILMNAQTGAVVASAHCTDLPDPTRGAPTADEMMAENGAVLKQMMATQVANCAASLKRDMLGL